MIVGGRNIAQEYFQLKSASEFVDFDVLGFGPVAAEVSETFDTFSNHPLAMPLSAFATGPDSRPKDRANTSRALDSDSETIYEEALDAPLVQDLLQGRARLYPADAEVITDNPEKLLPTDSAGGGEAAPFRRDLASLIASDGDELRIVVREAECSFDVQGEVLHTGLVLLPYTLGIFTIRAGGVAVTRRDIAGVRGACRPVHHAYTVNKNSNPRTQKPPPWPPSHADVHRPHIPIAIPSRPSSIVLSSTISSYRLVEDGSLPLVARSGADTISNRAITNVWTPEPSAKGMLSVPKMLPIV